MINKAIKATNKNKAIVEFVNVKMKKKYKLVRSARSHTKIFLMLVFCRFDSF